MCLSFVGKNGYRLERISSVVGKIEMCWILTSKVSGMPPSAEPEREYRDHYRGAGQGLTGLQDHLRQNYVRLYGSLVESTAC